MQSCYQYLADNPESTCHQGCQARRDDAAWQAPCEGASAANACFSIQKRYPSSEYPKKRIKTFGGSEFIMQPKNFQDWYRALTELHQTDTYDEQAAQQLRVMIGLKPYAVALLSGANTLVYAPWLLDGMHMNGRMVLHQTSSSEPIQALVQQQLDHDIRITAHVQPVKSFTEDIAKNRLDVILTALESETDPALDYWQSLLSESGIGVVFAAPEVSAQVQEEYEKDYFFSCLNGSEHSIDCLFMARKGSQHRRVRRSKSRAKTG